MKSILSIQDLSCVGRCSLTVAQPVLSAMGHRCSVLPTAVLSTHTGFPDPHVRDLTEEIAPIVRHWHDRGIDFDGISVGYLSDPAQAEAVLAALEGFGGKIVVDPVMGDNGKLYSRITQAHVQAMGRLCEKASVLLPNVTEAAFLTGTPYADAVAAPEAMLDKLMAFGPEAVVITGVSREDTIGFVGTDGEIFRHAATRIPRQLHGTGDLFTAVFTGAWISGKGCRESAALAAGFVERVVEHTKTVTPFGPEFEPQLPWLWEQL